MKILIVINDSLVQSIDSNMESPENMMDILNNFLQGLEITLEPESDCSCSGDCSEQCLTCCSDMYESKITDVVKKKMIKNLSKKYDISNEQANSFLFGGSDLDKETLKQLNNAGYDDSGTYDDNKMFWVRAGIKKIWLDEINLLVSEEQHNRLQVGNRVKDLKSGKEGRVYIVGINNKLDNYVIKFDNDDYQSREINELEILMHENGIEIDINDNEFSIDNTSDSEIEVKIKDDDVNIEVKDNKEYEVQDDKDKIEVQFLRLNDGNLVKAIGGDDNILYVQNIKEYDADIEFEFMDMVYKFPIETDMNKHHLDLDIRYNGTTESRSFNIKDTEGLEPREYYAVVAVEG